MMTQRLDPRSDRPLSLQLADALRAEIQEGQRRPGSQLPTESEFQHAYEVSRTTIRAALATLVAEGLVVSRKGFGSYVRDRQPLRRICPEDVNVGSATVTVRRNRVELLENDRAAFDADPKTDAGKRTVAIPPHVLPVLAEHMASWAGPDRVFVGRNGRPMRGDAVRQAFGRARRKAGMPGFRFHDLRHTGQTLAAATGATTKDLMRRVGHASPAASYRYLHAVDGRDAKIAPALSDLAAHGDAAKLPRSIVVKH
jgi:integrase